MKGFSFSPSKTPHKSSKNTPFPADSHKGLTQERKGGLLYLSLGSGLPWCLVVLTCSVLLGWASIANVLGLLCLGCVVTLLLVCWCAAELSMLNSLCRGMFSITHFLKARRVPASLPAALTGGPLVCYIHCSSF